MSQAILSWNEGGREIVSQAVGLVTKGSTTSQCWEDNTTPAVSK